MADINDKEKAGDSKESLNFIEQIITDDLQEGKNDSRVHTRFPPEPNGYLHIGHAKSICLNFGLSNTFNGKCNLRFDDTNPVKEDTEYVDSIREDVKWLGFDWQDREFYASDYFEKLYQFAIKLIQKGKAYVCELNPEQIRDFRGTPTVPGTESPYRNRPVEENLDLFQRMRAGEFEDGKYLLRAKIDMASPNMHMRDPIVYRIRHTHHHRTGDNWCIYPMYDFAHGLSDYIEGITHSVCTLEFEVHRPLYDWFLDQVIDSDYRPRQIEFARLNLNYTIMSKRKLLKLVEEKYVSGWDDPRMPTISGLRRRGYTPASIRNFAERIGVAKRENLIDVSLLEFSIREDLNKNANRVMAVLDPVKLVITNYPEGQTETLEATINPEKPELGKREVPFGREVYIERDDFMEDPPKKFFRLAPGREVRLKYAYIIKCEEVIKDETGKITEIRCTYDPETKSGTGCTRKVKAALHWVEASTALDIEVRMFDRLFNVENPDTAEEGKDFTSNINPNSVKVLTHCKLEPTMKGAASDQGYQFERLGYFCIDSKDSKDDAMVFNRTVTLKDSWSKAKKK
ncbi:MAG: glutamine--tRNA ligase/YqeY domain fusion protein [Hyphomicrobiales bacterium]